VKIFIGADHAGFELKESLKSTLAEAGHELIDVGAASLEDHDDYPRYAYFLATKILGEEDADDAHGILICGSGQGMSIAANRVAGIRAGLAWSEETGKVARADDNVNVLVLPARYVSSDEAQKIVQAWLDAKFHNDAKYQRRLDELEELYG
jgi:ribose 5-phosphate isomerase B